MAVWHSPGDLYYWFVTVFSGDLTIFFGIMLIVIAGLAGMFRMSPLVTGISFSLFAILMSAYIGNIYLLVIVIVALSLGWTIARIYNR
jgi:hypothetical protein